MTQDEIVTMAKEAGCIPRRHPEYWEDIQVFATPDVLVKFVQLVAAHEREACAKVCDEFQARDVGMQPAECAGAIRARWDNND